MLVNDDVWLIGDPHIGIDFDKRGTPITRRGDRERLQLQQFVEELNQDVRVNVMVGDLFDKPVVDIKLVHYVYDAYREAALNRPGTTFVLLAGNHDLFRQLKDPKTGKLLRGSFHALARMLLHIPNVIVVTEPQIIEDIVFFPWQWDITSNEQVLQYSKLPKIAVGHWDLLDFGGNNDHLCPVDSLHTLGVKEIYSGHMHTAGNYGDVICTGSMQPYTHAEDPEQTMYRTLTLQELEQTDPSSLVDMNVRILLESGEELPEVDCLSLTVKRIGEPDSVEVSEVGTGSFDLKATLFRNMNELGVIDPIQIEIWEKINVSD